MIVFHETNMFANKHEKPMKEANMKLSRNCGTSYLTIKNYIIYR